MNRAVPTSLVFHLVVLSLLLLFGARVDQTVVLPHRQISVKLVEFPKPDVSRPVVEDPPPVEEVVEESPVETAPPVDETPAPVPEDMGVQETEVEPQAPETPEPEEARPEEAPPRREPEPAATPDAETEPAVEAQTLEIPDGTPDELVSEETAIAGTDQVVPSQFQYYLTLLEGRVSRHWNPKMLGFREGSTRTCIVHFYIEKDGMIVRESVVKSSGVPLFDREALKAIKSVGRFLALPPGLDSGALGVTYVFTLKSRN